MVGLLDFVSELKNFLGLSHWRWVERRRIGSPPTSKVILAECGLVEFTINSWGII